MRVAAPSLRRTADRCEYWFPAGSDRAWPRSHAAHAIRLSADAAITTSIVQTASAKLTSTPSVPWSATLGALPRMAHSINRHSA